MTKVYIVDDHPLVIAGIRSLLEKEHGILWMGQSMTAADCLKHFEKNSSDVILMDISLPDLSGIELCREIKSRYPGIRVIALSTFHQGSYITKMMESGANGYVVKNADKQELLDAIREVMRGGVYMSFEAGKAWRENVSRQESQPVLTKREKEVLTLISEGLTNPQIAEKLFVSITTVDSHRKNLMAKLNAKNTAMLIRVAIEQHLVE